jgi:hypothetical protein
MVLYQKLRSAYGSYLSSRPDEFNRAKRLEMRQDDSGYVHKKQERVARLKWKPAVQKVLPKKSGETNMATSTYSGKIVKSRGKSSLALRNKYQKSGACTVVETYGKVTDLSLVAVGHIAWQLGGMQKAIVIAMLRKLFRLAGILPESTGQVLDIGSLTGLSQGAFELGWTMMTSNGTGSTGQYNLPLAATLDSLIVNTTLASDLTKMWTEANPAKLERIFLYEYFGNPLVATEASGRRMVASINLKQEILSISCNVHTVLQNRTLSASSSAYIDVNDAQPVKGPVYTFRGIPKTKSSGAKSLNVGNFRGIILWRNADMTPASENLEWAEPPAKNNFTNVKSTSYVRLAPGQLKDFSLTQNWKGNFTDLMLKFRLIRSGDDTAFCPGNSQVCYLEEELNSGSSNSITINYETQHTIGAVFTTKKTPNMGAYFESEAINLPAA